MSVVRVRLRLKGSPESLTVIVIHTWRRGEIDHQTMSTSGGPKETFANQVYDFFKDDQTINTVSMVRSHGAIFFIFQRGGKYYDVLGKEVEAAVIKIPPGGQGGPA